ncbi:unnamed protein product [Allacma fusca]|uniref:CRAL-TRIO domain-containing protein n=1 Tax=Allacma fusca TaxID=39272 RepID=A0A8J2PYX5_9HEXA|nr:unnamed protein product [Allacma fusca]
MGTINDQEHSILLKFRNHISDLELSESQRSDYFLIRWLRARGNDLDGAKATLSNYLEYRRKDNIDNILLWEPPEDVRTMAPYQFLGVDSENSPVIFVPFNRWNCRKLSELGLASDVIRYVDRLYEEIENTMIDKLTPEGIPTTQFVVIIDTYNLSLLTFSSLIVVDTLLQIAKKFEAYHPESVKRFFIPNAGRAFSAAFTLVKPILGPKTANKFKIFGTNPDIYKKEMLKELPAGILPPKFGGTNMTIPGGDKLDLNCGILAPVDSSYVTID